MLQQSSCSHCYTSAFIMGADPTKTLTLRNRFAADMNRRFNKLVSVINESIIENDCFGKRRLGILSSKSPFASQLLAAAMPGQFDFARSADKVEAFMGWLKIQEEEYILSEGHRGARIVRIPGRAGAAENAWTSMYIESGYQAGIRRGRAELRKAGVDIPDFGDQIRDDVTAAFNQPFHIDRVGLLYTRTFNELKGITDGMDQQISRVLAQGMAEGRNPRQIAGMLERTITGSGGDLSITDTLGRFIPAKRRAEMLARTEIIRAHHAATIQEYRNAGIEGVVVLVEWSTAGDGRVCPECSQMQGRRYTIDQIEPMIPLHPFCRCVAIPAMEGGGLVSGIRITPTSSEEWEPPMQVIENMGYCLVGNIAILQSVFINVPQSCSDYVREGKVWKLKGQEIDEETAKRLEEMRIPPGWSNVVVSFDPTKKIQAIGMDAAGRWQYRYSAEHISEAAKAKFDRLKSFSRDLSSIRKRMEDAIQAGDDRAFLLKLEDRTAIRAGSDTDFKAKKKAYGLTTLLRDHVEVRGNQISLRFIAKEGIEAKYKLNDPVLARWLENRKSSTEIGQKLFPDIPASRLNDYIKELADGKKYSIKDYRTYHGSRIAFEELQQYKGQKLTKKQKTQIVKQVSTKVSEFLHNTPTMAKNSYIDPTIWDIIGGL